MRSVTLRLEDLRTTILNLGYVGENQHTRFNFDSKKMYDQYPHAAASLTVVPPEGESYPAVIERDGDLVIWDITDSDLITDGDGEIQLAFTSGETVAKTYIARTKTCRSLVPTGDIPDGLDDFLTRAGAALTAIPEAIDAALAEAKASGEFDGQDGFSPTATVSKVGSTATISITDKNGTTTAEISDGSDGDPGADGYSPTATVTKSGKTATITITDKNGTTTAQVSDGEDGQAANVIDDTTTTATDKAWSAKKTAEEVSTLNGAIGVTQPTAQESDIGKFLKLKTIDQNGKPTEFEYGSGGGGGGVSDVQVNGTSVVTQGVANVPLMSTNNFGVAKVSEGYGVTISNGYLFTSYATGNDIKSGASSYKVIAPATIGAATFYGLAKAAGDTSQAALSYGVGTYTESAKSAIASMLDAPETVSGTTPSITAKAGVRYICGEVSTLTIVVPSSGIIDVTFDSGSTATVLTVTPPTGMTMKWAGGFNPASLDANTTYEINIADGCLGVCGKWT